MRGLDATSLSLSGLGAAAMGYPAHDAAPDHCERLDQEQAQVDDARLATAALNARNGNGHRRLTTLSLSGQKLR